MDEPGVDPTVDTTDVDPSVDAYEVKAQVLSTTDASVWATEFCRLFPGADWGLMVGWFANAIETGRDAGRAEEETL
jgi:hypothetical protein